MEFKKIDFKNLDDKTKGLLKLLAIVIGAFIAIIIFFGLYTLFVGQVLSFPKIENVMIRATKEYVSDHKEILEKGIYGTIEIKTSDLAAEGLMKDLSKYTRKGVMCTGSVLVFKNLDDYSYSPKLDCKKDYKYKLLVDEILKEENIVTEESGIYKIESEAPYYVYRGENVDNYVTFADETWRILRIDNDKNIRLIQENSKNNTPWDDRYNVEKQYNSGINDFEGTQASRLKDKIMELYNDKEYITKENKSLIVPKEYCIGKKKEDDLDKTGTIECSIKSEIMGAGSIYISEYLEASLDPNCFSIKSNSCANYNYLAKLNNYWTLTANADTTYEVFAVSETSYSKLSSSYSYVNLVLTINGNINYISGDGTKINPYVIKPIIK